MARVPSVPTTTAVTTAQGRADIYQGSILLAPSVGSVPSNNGGVTGRGSQRNVKATPRRQILPPKSAPTSKPLLHTHRLHFWEYIHLRY